MTPDVDLWGGGRRVGYYQLSQFQGKTRGF